MIVVVFLLKTIIVVRKTNKSYEKQKFKKAIFIFYRSLIECAALCQCSPYCFAFMFDKQSNLCQYGNGGYLRVPSKFNASTVTQAVYIKNDFTVQKGKIKILYAKYALLFCALTYHQEKMKS